MKIKQTALLKELLEENYQRFHQLDFIPDDPISIPHRFSKKEDIEIIGFLTALIAWGQRTSIINSANRMLKIMDHAPHDFILNHQPKDLKKVEGFVHRTMNADDLIFFLSRLQGVYLNYGGLEKAICNSIEVKDSLHQFKQFFFEAEHLKRSQKHLADPYKGSSAKRLNMFLRWMVRPKEGGVDFGIWNAFETKSLMMPLDVHTATVSRKLGLLKRKQNDWKAVEELTQALRKFDSNDPVKYDYALFGIGVNKVAI